MQVTLIDYQQNALDILLFTRSTRLNQTPGLMRAIREMPHTEKLAELEKARNTIQSSWEFITYIFAIEGVSRSFTHQLVRTRSASYAQQSQRMVELTDFQYHSGPSIRDKGLRRDIMHDAMLNSARAYRTLLDDGADTQDARDVLPSGVKGNITAMFSLRSLHEMALKRLCVRTQGEYQQVFQQMRERVLDVHPWAKDFIHVQCAWNGTCAFPLFDMKKCHIKPDIFNPETGLAYDGQTEHPPATVAEIRKFFGDYSRLQSIQPKAEDQR